MGPTIATDILRAVFSGIILAVLFGAIATWLWTIPRLFRGQPLFPETPIVERRKAPWGLGTVLLVLATYALVTRDAFTRYADATRAERPVAKVEAPAQVGQKEAGGPAPAKPEPNGEDREKKADELPLGLSPLEAMSIQGAINVAFLFLVPGLARLTCRARLRDFGLSLHNWRRQVALGVVAVLFLMPIVYAVQGACIYFLGISPAELEKNKHPLEKMLRETFSPHIAIVALVTAVIIAPAFEELLFRGFLQSWLVKVFDRLFERDEVPPPEKDPEPPPAGEGRQIPPLAESPLYDPDLDRLPPGTEADTGFGEAAEESRLPARDDARHVAVETCDKPYRPGSSFAVAAAIVLTSMIFAGLHAPQWPAPIPLFLLALGFGLVAQRTGSLIAPICMHAIFNGFSTMMLFYAVLERPDQAKPPARPVLERVVPAEKAGAIAPDVAPRLQPGKT